MNSSSLAGRVSKDSITSFFQKNVASPQREVSQEPVAEKREIEETLEEKESLGESREEKESK